MTKNNRSSRLDFGKALEQIIPIEEAVNPKNEVKKLNVEPDVNIKPEVSTSMKAEDEDGITEKKNLKEQHDVPETKQLETHITQKESTLEEKTSKRTSNNSALFKSIARSGRGVQKSVYFENEVYEYIKSISDEYNANFSNVVNLLLKEYIANNE